MFKKFVCLAVTMMLVVGLIGSAMAASILEVPEIWLESEGYLRVIALTDYTDEKDLNFSANTENGSLAVLDPVVLRKKGTSWFVILEYDHYKNDEHKKTEDRALKDLANVIGTEDNGTVVLCNESHVIGDPVNATRLSEMITSKPAATDASYLSMTLDAVIDYIKDHPDKLMENVAVVIVTNCPASKVNDTMISHMGDTLAKNVNITTYAVVIAGRDIYPNDRTQGEKLIRMAQQTAAGDGYVTATRSDSEADKAIQTVIDSERRKVRLILDAEKASNVGKTLTLTQTTAGGMAMPNTTTLSDEFVEEWTKRMKDRPGEVVVPSTFAASTASSMVFTNVNPPVDSTPPGISTTLLIGIIIGAVILILAIVLIVIRVRNNNTKKKPSVSQIYGDSSRSAGAAAQPSGVTITLNGNNGSVLKGQMKNGQLTVGRQAGRAAVAVPNDGKLSGLHATFMKNGNQMTIVDNNSTNGTKVNGVRITSPVVLQQNDTVTMGSVTYTVTWH